jgi:SAM-dependent methyltransferase
VKIGTIPEGLVERLALRAGLAPTPVIDTFHAVIVARAIMVATKLGIFDAVASHPRSAADIAATLSVDAKGLTKLNNLLVSLGYLRFDGRGYAATRLSAKWLRRDSSQSLRDNMLLRFLEWEAIETIEDFVRTGKALDVHELISGDQWQVYQRGMQSLARLSAGEVARRVLLPRGAATMLDVGGGHGAYSVAFCRRYRQLQATVLDVAEAVDAAAPLLASEGEGPAERVRHRVGNALTDKLGESKWDLVFMSHLVHHFSASANEDLVRRAALALRPGGTLAILDVLRAESPSAGSQTGMLLDLYFAVTSSSGTWSKEEISRWTTQAGMGSARTIQLRTAPGLSVVMAAKPKSGF